MPGGPVAPLELVEAWQTDAFPHGIRARQSLTTISIVFTVLAFCTVLARLHDRVFSRHNAGLDDVLIVAALIPNVALCVSICLAERHGFDRHAWDLTADMAVNSRKFILAISILYLASTGLTKVSILYFYRRIGEVRTWFKRTIWVNIVFITAYTLAFIVAMPLECRPTAAYWWKASPVWRTSHEYHCINEGAKMITAGAISVLQDFIACVLPMALFWDLRISRRAKFALGLVFSLGLLTCICGVIRTRVIHRVFFETYDVTWAVRPVLALTIIESSLGITCASMPALKSGVLRCFHIVIDPFTYGSSKSTSRRWKNPFFNSYQQSFRDYFDTSGSRNYGAKGRGGCRNTPGLAVPQNTNAACGGAGRAWALPQSTTADSTTTGATLTTDDAAPRLIPLPTTPHDHNPWTDPVPSSIPTGPGAEELKRRQSPPPLPTPITITLTGAATSTGPSPEVTLHPDTSAGGAFVYFLNTPDAAHAAPLTLAPNPTATLTLPGGTVLALSLDDATANAILLAQAPGGAHALATVPPPPVPPGSAAAASTTPFSSSSSSGTKTSSSSSSSSTAITSSTSSTKTTGTSRTTRSTTTSNGDSDSDSNPDGPDDHDGPNGPGPNGPGPNPSQQQQHQSAASAAVVTVGPLELSPAGGSGAYNVLQELEDANGGGWAVAGTVAPPRVGGEKGQGAAGEAQEAVTVDGVVVALSLEEVVGVVASTSSVVSVSVSSGGSGGDGTGGGAGVVATATSTRTVVVTGAASGSEAGELKAAATITAAAGGAGGAGAGCGPGGTAGGGGGGGGPPVVVGNLTFLPAGSAYWVAEGSRTWTVVAGGSSVTVGGGRTVVGLATDEGGKTVVVENDVNVVVTAASAGNQTIMTTTTTVTGTASTVATLELGGPPRGPGGQGGGGGGGPIMTSDRMGAPVSTDGLGASSEGGASHRTGRASLMTSVMMGFMASAYLLTNI
ncbi:uncharacterized protein BKCO1_14000166 [Diplodia corticola]|uniref:Integral membrane protein n=1 Tax=Diplodia corticola TaxID=236234 RepID=A0A1J9S5V9_9PEZI|nr:uncharacterized protein BKCO1_14000166 [Diplodia corticola]OJD35903.1 integral membrane protein [Diplodia corticola]